MIKTLRDFNVKNKRVLVRVDLNVPMDENGNILDDFRIRETVPTIKYLMEERAKIILMTHIGRPGGKIIESLRVSPIQNKLMEYLDVSIIKASDCIGKEVEKWTREMQSGEILLLENLKFHIEEEKNDDQFTKELSKLGDIYINDAFGTCHQPYASIIGVPGYLPSGIGFLIEKEIKNLKAILKDPKRPMVAIIGGKKVDTKTKFIDKILEVTDFLLVGGLIKKEIEEQGIKIKYPEKMISPVNEIKTSLDIGPDTINLFKEKILKAKTVFWNGPLGMVEKKEFSKGTLEIAKAIIESKAFSVVGGGETVEFLNRTGLSSKFNHVSTGGGAMLQFIVEEEGLPGLKVLG